MAEAPNPIRKDDIKKFIVTLRYLKSSKDWPKSTIVLSKVKIDYVKSSERLDKIPKNEIHRNDKDNHAEIIFFYYLKKEINRLQNDKEVEIKKIKVLLVQNYSPCRDCADAILKFKETEVKDIKFSLTVKFANFYRHYKQRNIEGLENLLRNNVSLELLQGKGDWKDFLSNTIFVQLDEDEYNELLERATSNKRVDREEVDRKKMLDDIESSK